MSPIKPIVRVILPFVLLTSAQAQMGELSRNERWRQDVRFYAAELPKHHKSLFFQLPEREFKREVESLEARIAKLSDDQIMLELMRITARIEDGHTQVNIPGSSFSRFPLQIDHFAEGWFVTRTTDEYKQTLGAQLIQIGKVKVERAEQRVRDIIAADNEFHRKRRARIFLTWAEALQAKDILKNKEMGRFIFLNRDGKRLSLDLRAVSEQEWNKIQWREVLDSAKKPLALRNTGRNYLFEYLPNTKALYLAYNSCVNDPINPFVDFVKEVFAVVDSRPTEKFIVDLRRNGGGDSSVIKSLYSELEKRPQLTGKGKLFVLVSNGTFSSAFMNAFELRDRMKALWIGGSPATRPNHFGEVRTFKLPHSTLEVSYSTKFYELAKDSKLSFMPVDIAIEPTFAGYREGRDPILQAALEYKAN